MATRQSDPLYALAAGSDSRMNGSVDELGDLVVPGLS